MLLTLNHVQTLVALVEEGSVMRASRRLGVAHSTVSFHVKLLEDELGCGLFTRAQGGLMASLKGLEAYESLYPLLARAVSCSNAFRRGAFDPPTPIPVTLPKLSPDSLLLRAFRELEQDQTLGELVQLAPGKPGAALQLRYGTAGDTAPGGTQLRDAWVLVRSSSTSGWASEPLPLTALQGLRLTLPEMPDALVFAASAIADHIDATVDRTGMPFQQLAIQMRPRHNFCALVPLSALNLVVAAATYECLVLEPSPFDPLLLVDDLADTGLGERLLTRIGDHIAAARAQVDADPCDALCASFMSLKHCCTFQALYEEGNVRRAAQRLFVVQPAVTVQLRMIEDYLGLKLFDRKAHGLVARHEAHALYAMVEPLLKDFECARSQLKQRRGLEGAILRIGLMPALDDDSLVAEAFSSALENWTQKHPYCVVRVAEAPSRALVHEVKAGSFDFAITDREFAEKSVSFEPLIQDSMVVVTRADTNLIPSGPISLRDALDLPLVLPSSLHGLRALLMQNLPPGTQLHAQIEVDSLSTALAMIRIGRYATILPWGAIYKSRSLHRLSVHAIHDPVISRSICLARPIDGDRSSIAEDLFVELKKAFHTHGAASAMRSGPLH